MATYRSGNPDDLASALLRQVDDPVGRSSRVALVRARIGELSWEHEADRLLELLERVAGDRA